MANNFSKEDRVAFEDIAIGFQSSLVMSRYVNIYKTSQEMMERTNNTIWRPMPFIATSIDAAPGVDISSSYKTMTQLSVPANIGYNKSIPWHLNAYELRDALQEGRLVEAAKQRLSADVDKALMNIATSQATVFVKRQSGATGFDDVAAAEAAFNEIGVPGYGRYFSLSTRDYNGMASNLAGRQNMTDLPKEAYQRAYVGMIASFDIFKQDFANRKAAALGGAGITMSTLNAANNYYIPKATDTGVGGTYNVDNRFQDITVSSTTNVAVGDAFTVAGINSVSMINKQDSGQLKTFRVIAVNSGTSLKISPPMITNQVASSASEQYQNCTAVSTSATAAITFLNTAAGYLNPFWQKDALEILPARYVIPENAGTSVLRATTDQGLEIVMQKTYNQSTMEAEYRIDIPFGVVCKQPEMVGVMMFSQP